MRFMAVLFAVLFPVVAWGDVYLVHAPPGGIFKYGHVAVDAGEMVAEFQRSPDRLIYTDKAVFMARYASVGIDVVENGLTYTPGTRWDEKRYVVFPVLGLRSNCTTFVSGIDPNSRRIRLPDVYAAKLKRQAERAK